MAWWFEPARGSETSCSATEIEGEKLEKQEKALAPIQEAVDPHSSSRCSKLSRIDLRAGSTSFVIKGILISVLKSESRVGEDRLAILFGCGEECLS